MLEIKSSSTKKIEVYCLYYGDGYDYNNEYYFASLESVINFFVNDYKETTIEHSYLLKKLVSDNNVSIENIQSILDDICEFKTDKFILYDKNILIYY